MKAVFLFKLNSFGGNLNRYLLLGLAVFLFSGPAFAADVSLAWDASASSTSADFGGYRIYYGETTKAYTSNVDAGKATTFTITGLTAGKTYFFALKSYNAAKTTESTAYSNEVSKAIPAAPTSTASITASVTSGPAPLQVTFSTQPATTYSWNFGNGTTSTAQTAMANYPIAGSYTVTLTTNAGVATQIITVTAPPAPIANFSATSTSGVAPLTVTFTNTSTGNITSTAWNYGDGSTGTSPSHTYNAVGTYSVSLTVTGPGGSNTKTSANLINATAPPPTAQPATCATTGLVAAYGFEETTGTTVKDTSGKGNVGTIREALRIRGGRYGRALRFDGINDFVTVRDSASLDLLGAYTIEAWVKPRAVVRSSILAKEVHPGGAVSGGTAYDLYAYGDGGNLYDSAFNDGAYRVVSGTSPLPINVWSHLVATYDGSSQRLYLNGALVKARAQSGQIIQSANPLRIGGNAIWGEYFNGAIDEVRLYNCALAPSEILTDLAKPIGK